MHGKKELASHSKKDFQIFCQVLTQLHRRSTTLWRDSKNLSNNLLTDNTNKNFSHMIDSKRPMEEKELEELIRKNSGNLCLNLNNPTFYLPPLEKDHGFIPMLTVDCDFSGSSPKVTLHVGMFRYVEQHRLQGFGFRFEIHQTGDEHDYWHVQVTTEEVGGTGLPDCPPWLPASTPCIPARANNSVSLIFCALISFYGKKIYTKLFSGMNIPGEYTEYLKDIL
jgi:hypothetical protein